MKTFVLYRFEDKKVQKDMKLVPYKIVNKEEKPYISSGTRWRDKAI